MKEKEVTIQERAEKVQGLWISKGLYQRLQVYTQTEGHDNHHQFRQQEVENNELGAWTPYYFVERLNILNQVF